MMKTPELAFGRSYLFWERNGLRGYAAYLRHLRRGMRGLCISGVDQWRTRRTHPARSVVVWLSQGAGGPVIRTLNPRKPHKLLLAVREFLRSRRGRIVLIDGMESLLSHNPFEIIMQVLQQINDEVAMRGGILIVTVSPGHLRKREMSLLEREFESLDEELVVLSLLESA